MFKPMFKCIIGVFISYFVLSSGIAFATESIVFGPKTYIRGNGQPETFADSFDVINPAGQFRMEVLNGEWGGKGRIENAVSSARIYINGLELVSTNDFNQNVAVIERAIPSGVIQQDNVVEVCMASAPGSKLTVTVFGMDQEPPPVTDTDIPAIFITFPHDKAKINDPTPTITVKYKDLQSGINQSSFTAYLNSQDISSQFVLGVNGGEYQVTEPLPDGLYSLKVGIQDNAGNSNSDSIVFEIDTARPDQTTFSGFIEGYVYNRRSDNPLVGVTITCRDALLNPLPGRVLTDSNGHFSYPTPAVGKYYVDINMPGFTYAQRWAVVETARPVGVDPVYLMPFDLAVTTITPSGGTHTDSRGHVQIIVPSGAVNHDINVRATEIDSFIQLPTPLPDSSVFTFCFELEPHGQTFALPVTIRVKNYLGFSPGDSIPVGIFSPEQGEWQHLAMAYVQPDGQWIEYQANRFSWHDINAAPQPAPWPPEEYMDYTSDDENIEWESGECEYSKIGFHSGNLSKSIDLPPVKLLEQWRGLSFTYNSNTAKPSFLVDYRASLHSWAIAKTTSMQLNFLGKIDQTIFNWEPTYARFAEIREAKNYLGEWLPTGEYPYALTLSNNFDSLVYWSAGCFGCGPVDPTRVYVRQYTPAPLEKIGLGIVNNQRGSPYGAGWGIEGIYKIIGNAGDSRITIQKGSDQMSVFTWSFSPVCWQDSTIMVFDTSLIIKCDTAVCDTTILVDTTEAPVADSAWGYFNVGYTFYVGVIEPERVFLLKERDGTEILFDSLAQMVKKTEPNNIVREYAYNDLGLLVEVTDPLERKITLEYDNFDHLRQVTDQVGRVTLFNISPDNELLKVTFPDGSSRSFEYDDLLMTAEIDENVTRTEYIYERNHIHQVEGPACCSGILATFEPSSAHGLIQDLPPGEGTDSLPAQLFRPEDASDIQIGARNDTTVMLSNKMGQVTYGRDALGNEKRYDYDRGGRLTKITRSDNSSFHYVYNKGEQMTQQTDPCGGITSFSYSYKNNYCLPMLTSIRDPLGNTSFNLYNDKGQRIAYVNGSGDTTFYTYNSYGLLETIVNPLGDTTVYRYDSNLNLYAIIFANGDSNILINDSIGNLIQSIDPDGYSTRYEYDIMGRMLRQIDPSGGVTTYSRDAKGNLSSLTDADGNMTMYTYDGRNRLIRRVNPLGDSTLFVYDDADNLIQKITPNEDTVRYAYDLTGQLLQESYPEDTVLYRYDSKGNLLFVKNKNTVNEFKYDVCDNLSRAVTNSTYALLHSYDQAGNRTEVQLGTMVKTPGQFEEPVSFPAGDGPNMSAAADFNNDGYVDLAVPNVGSDNISILFNHGDGTFAPALNYNFGTTDPRVVLAADFNSDRNLDLAIIAGNKVYIALNNGDGSFGTAQSYPAGNYPVEADTGDFDGDGDVDLAVADNYDGVRLMFNNGTGVFSVPVSYAVGSYPQDVTSGDFDRDGDLDLAVVNYYSSFISVLLNNGNGTFATAVKYSADYHGNQITNADFDGDGYPDLAVTYSYYGDAVYVFRNNGNGTFAAGKSFYVGYFPYGMISDDLNDDGRPDLAFSGASSEFWVLINDGSSGFLPVQRYSGNCNMRGVTCADLNADSLPDLIGAGYDCDIVDVLFNGALIPTVLQSGVYAYDNQNRITSIKVANKALSLSDSIDIAFAYDKLGRTITAGIDNGPNTTYEYDKLSRLTRLQNEFGGMPVSYYDYQYDKRGNRISMTDMSGIHQYTYDPRSQLLTATHPHPILPNEFYTYDPVGNRLSSHLSGSHTYNSANQLLEDDHYIYSYDRNGNLISKTDKVNGDRVEYDFDTENKLIGFRNLQSGAVTESSFYKYDGSGRRVEKCVNGLVTKYVYDREDIVMEGDSANGISAYYVHGSGIDNPFAMIRDSSLYYYLKDGLGSVLRVVDSSGNVALDYLYDSYGNIKQFVGALANPYTYTGREYDGETELYYYRARYYDAFLGRFASEDPVLNLNLYAYVMNRPLNTCDPLGLNGEELIDKSIDYYQKKEEYLGYVQLYLDWKLANKNLIDYRNSFVDYVKGKKPGGFNQEMLESVKTAIEDALGYLPDEVLLGNTANQVLEKIDPEVFRRYSDPTYRYRCMGKETGGEYVP
jgi:RHS repeat-associated protein